MTSATPQTRPVIIALACLPTFDCILNQLNTGLHIEIGTLTLLEVVRAPLLLILILAIAWRLYSGASAVRDVPFPSLAGAALVSILVAKEFATTGKVSFVSLNAYGQLLYWIAVWTYVSLQCRDRREAIVLIRGVVAAALVAGASIMAGRFAGGLNPYMDDGVDASAGWFDTAKMITGVLLTGAVLLLYLGARRRTWLYQLGSLGCCVTAVLTYARAGQAALLIVLVWLAIWSVIHTERLRANAFSCFVLVAVLAGSACVPLAMTSQDLRTRWDDLHDPDKAGSGRSAIWQIALDDFQNSPQSDIVFGRGYLGMADLLYKDYGVDVRHTHDDLFDMMLVGGICGIVWWVALMTSLARRAGKALTRYEGCAAMAIFLIFACQGQLTGQMWGTDAMVVYSVGITCLAVIGRERRADSSGSLSSAWSRSSAA